MACREEEAAAPPPVRPVLSVVVQPQAQGGQAFTGVVEPQFQAGLGFRLLGRVLARDVDVGDPVEKGQRLAAIDPVAQELAVRSARAELSNASAQLETATATELRQRRLMEQNVVSAADFEAAEQAREAASANVSRARANLAIAEEQLGYTQILADFDGVVTAVGAEVGQVVSPGETVVTVARPDIREAVIDVPAELAGLVGSGTRFEVALELDRSVRGRGRGARDRAAGGSGQPDAAGLDHAGEPAAELPPRHHRDRRGRRRAGRGPRGPGLGDLRRGRPEHGLGGRSRCHDRRAGRGRRRRARREPRPGRRGSTRAPASSPPACTASSPARRCG